MKNSYFKIENLVKNARKDDLEAKEEILIMLEGLIVNKIKKYNYSRESFEDLKQEGRYTILKCIKNYNKSKGTHFLGYIKSQLKYKYLNMSKKYWNKELLNLNSSISSEGNIELIDLLEDNFDSHEFLYENQIKDVLNKSMKKLTKRQGQIIYYYYFQGLTMKEIGSKLNISYRTVVNVKSLALKKLRSSLESRGYLQI